MKNTTLLSLTMALALGQAAQSLAVDFHVATAQELQNALTLAAANGADDVIYLTTGNYVGNFNYDSAEAGSLTLQGEPGTTNTGITIDGAGGGRSISVSSSANAAITVRGITFLRNCGSSGNAGLRIATGSGADVLVEDCRFISPASTSGMGLELASGHNATVRQCTVTGVTSGGGVGISISVSGVSASVTVQNCSFTTNSGGGLSVSGAGTVAVYTNTFTGNSAGHGGGLSCSCSGATITLSGNTFNGNTGVASEWGWPSGYGGGLCAVVGL